jgi:hypothetical protein
MDFDTWYVDHFGKRQSDLSLHLLHANVVEARLEYERAQKLWDDVYMWEVNKDAAKQAWDERIKQEKFVNQEDYKIELGYAQYNARCGE